MQKPHHTAHQLSKEICSLGEQLMVTLLSDYMGARTYDIEKGRIGYSPMHRDLFIEQLEECLTQSGAIMVRKCLTQKVTINTPKGPMRVPMKELYAASCQSGVIVRFNQQMVQEAQETDASTGQPIEREPAVVYGTWPTPSGSV